MKIISTTNGALRLGIMTVLYCFIACGGSMGGLGDNSGQIALSSGCSSLPADNLSACPITAAVTDSAGAPAVIGTAVTFSTDLGRFGNGDSVYTATTKDEFGLVVVSFLAGNRSGTATITASTETASQKIDILVGTAAGGITLTADPLRIPPDGTSSSALTATITSSTGDPIPPGTAVEFTTTLGTFANNTQHYGLTTVNDTGVVTVSLISGETPGTALVQCRVGGMSQSIRIEISAENPDDVEASLLLSASPENVSLDGTATSAITAVVRDQGGLAPAIGTKVVFTTSLGMFPNGDPAYTAATTDEGVGSRSS